MTPVVVGVGQTVVADDTDASAVALAAQAIVAALDDAGVALEDVEGVVRFDREAAWEYDFPGLLRVRALRYYGAVPDGPGSAPALVRLAAMAVSQGLARVVVGYHARSGPRPALAPAVLEAACGGVDVDRRPVAAHGGCAFVVSTAERSTRAPVPVLASLQVALPSAGRHLEAWLASRREGVLRAAARRLFADAGTRPEAVDVACLYDSPPALVRLALDDYGLAGSRVAPRAHRERDVALDGIDDVVEAVRQLRGEADEQVAGARVALVAGSPLEPTSAVLLGVAR